MADNNDNAYKQANILAGDAILNYRTVAGLATDKQIVQTYDEYLELPMKAQLRKANVIGFWFGFS